MPRSDRIPVPFTVAGLAVLVLLGLVSGALHTPLLDLPWGDRLGYGVPTTGHGQWWTLVTGVPFAITPLCYVAVLASFAGFVGLAELRLGTRRTAAIWLVGQLASVAGAVALLDLVAPDGLLASTVDVGPSGGALAAAAVLTAGMAPRQRLLARLALLAYPVGALLLVPHLADLVHLVAVLGGVPAGAVLTRRATAPVHPADPDRALALLHRHGGGSLSWMTTWPGAEFLHGVDGFVAYHRHAGVAVALGDPVGSARWRAAAPAEFAAHCAARGLVPCWFAVGAGTADAAAGRTGARRVQVAEDTVLDLPGLEFRGKAWQDVRTARNRAAREGIEFRLITLADADPRILAQVRDISARWLRGRHTPELRFTLGGVAEAMDPRVRVGIAVDAHGTVHGVTSWLPVLGEHGAPHGWALDVMRRGDDGFRPVVEFLIAEACLAFRAEGARFVSLSGAPLVRADTSTGGFLHRLLDVSATVLEPLYGFRSLHAFKAKFQPRHEPLYLLYRSPVELPRITAAVLRAYLVKPRTGPVPAASTGFRRPTARSRDWGVARLR